MTPEIVLRVNKQADGRVLANMYTRVNAKTIRRFKHNGGRDMIAIPSYTLPANVIMNGGLYTSEQIDKHFAGLEGTPAPVGHPSLDGKFISARSNEGLVQGWIGAWNRNVKKSGDRIYLEKWVDVEVAASTEKGRELLARVEAMERGEDVPPIHTSVAMFLYEEPAPEGSEHEWVANIVEMDHDAILLDEIGAATPEQGVGLMVNADKAHSIKANAGVLSDTSYRAQERRLEQAARDRFVPVGQDTWVFIADFDDKNAIVVVDGDASIYGYTLDGGVITFEDNGTPVERQESWVRRLPGVNALLDFLKPNHERARPETPEESDMPLTKDEIAEIAQTVGTVVANAVGAALAPVTESLGTVAANQTKMLESVTANQQAEEEQMRKVVIEKHGAIIGNSLKGVDLVNVYKECGSAAPVIQGNGQTDKPNGLGIPVLDANYTNGVQ